MVMQKKALICALEVLINRKYVCNMHVHEKLVNSDNGSQKLCHYKL